MSYKSNERWYFEFECHKNPNKYSYIRYVIGNITTKHSGYYIGTNLRTKTIVKKAPFSSPESTKKSSIYD